MNDLREKKLGNLNGFTGGSFAGNVYDKSYLCPSITTMGGGNRQPMILEKLNENVDSGNERKESQKSYFKEERNSSGTDA